MIPTSTNYCPTIQVLRWQELFRNVRVRMVSGHMDGVCVLRRVSLQLQLHSKRLSNTSNNSCFVCAHRMHLGLYYRRRSGGMRWIFQSLRDESRTWRWRRNVRSWHQLQYLLPDYDANHVSRYEWKLCLNHVYLCFNKSVINMYHIYVVSVVLRCLAEGPECMNSSGVKPGVCASSRLMESTCPDGKLLVPALLKAHVLFNSITVVVALIWFTSHWWPLWIAHTCAWCSQLSNTSYTLHLLCFMVNLLLFSRSPCNDTSQFLFLFWNSAGQEFSSNFRMRADLDFEDECQFCCLAADVETA